MDEIAPGFLSLLNIQPGANTPPARPTSGRRAALARLLTEEENPLTARVMVNRLWQHYFGRGIVGTSSDFGLKGDRPTHPDLLDWLARDFIEHRWSLKHVHRRIVTSATYRQASTWRAAAAAADPENRLLWRYPRHRLEGEVIRDSLLAVAGRLNPRMGGPSVFPELPPGMVTRGGWRTTEDPLERDRRSIYIFVRRNTRYPMLEVFDMPDTHESCARRNVTTSPAQALTLLNSELTIDWARSFAERVLDQARPDDADRVRIAWRLAFSRMPTDEEVADALTFLARQRDLILARHRGETPTCVAHDPLTTVDPAGAAALVDFCHALMNANEFAYLN
jgi:hypothetical protein